MYWSNFCLRINSYEWNNWVRGYVHFKVLPVYCKIFLYGPIYTPKHEWSWVHDGLITYIIMVHLLAPWDNGIDDVNLFVMIFHHLPASTELGVKTSNIPRMPHIWKWLWTLESFPHDSLKADSPSVQPRGSILVFSGQVLKTWAGVERASVVMEGSPGWEEEHFILASGVYWHFCSHVCVFPSPRSLRAPQDGDLFWASLSLCTHTSYPSYLWADVSIIGAAG